jgi:hypothetical protein
MRKVINNIKEETISFLSQMGIDNYSFEIDGKLIIPIGWKGNYIRPNRLLTPNEQTIIDYIEYWG